MTTARRSETDSEPFNPFDPELWQNSYPILKELRDEDPVRMEPALGMSIVTGHEEAEQIFRDADGDHRYLEYQRQRMGEGVEDQPYCHHMSKWVLMRSGEDHRRLRRTITSDFTPRRVEALRNHLFEIAHDLVDGFADKGEIEVVEGYASVLPLMIISRLLDVPSRDHGRIERWINGFKHAVQYLPMSPEELAETNEAITGLNAYFAQLIEHRRKNPGGDLLSSLIAEADAGAMTEEELIVNAWGLYAAGHETSGNAICDAMNTLMTHPDQLRLLLEDWSLLPNAVHEMLRFDGPGLATNRIFPHEVQVGGHTIAAHTPVLLFMAGANRDPRHFDNPDEFDIKRPRAKDHLGFGHGPHRCVGQHLANLTIAVAIQVFFTRLRNVRLVGEIEWTERTVFHGPRLMTVTWDSVSPR
jgi:hypothetical protein